jgi:hypothetical protein
MGLRLGLVLAMFTFRNLGISLQQLLHFGFISYVWILNATEHLYKSCNLGNLLRQVLCLMLF